MMLTASCNAATAAHSPGTLVEVWLTFLQPELLLRMHATEGAYDLLQLQDINLCAGSSVSAYRCTPHYGLHAMLFCSAHAVQFVLQPVPVACFQPSSM